MARSRPPRQLSASRRSRGSPHPTWFLPLTAALPAFFVCPVWAAKWDIVPRLTASESYTDNVNLAPEGLKRSDWVTQVRPGISIEGGGPRFQISANYAADFIYRQQEESREVRHQLNAGAKAEVLQQLFFVDASASISQQNISLLGPQTQSNINTTANLADVATFQVSPYLRHTFGADAQGEARYTYSRVISDAATSLTNSGSNRIDLSLASGPSYKLYTWNVAYHKATIAYGTAQQPDVTTQSITAGGRRLITSQFYLTSSIGYEDNDYRTLGEPPQGFFWNTGFDYTPTDRTRLVVSTGRRYYGKNNFFQFNHRSRRTVWMAGYSEQITTTHNQFLLPSIVSTETYIDTLFLTQVPDPLLRQQAVQNFIAHNGLPASLLAPVTFFTNQVFLDKRWHASVGLQGVRNTVLANVFKSSRTAQDNASGIPQSGDFALSQAVDQTGVGLNWTWRISPQTAANANIGFTRSEFPFTGREEDRTYVNLGVTRQFYTLLSGALTYRRQQTDVNQGLSAGGYTENVVSASVTMRF